MDKQFNIDKDGLHYKLFHGNSSYYSPTMIFTEKDFNPISTGIFFNAYVPGGVL